MMNNIEKQTDNTEGQQPTGGRRAAKKERRKRRGRGRGPGGPEQTREGGRAQCQLQNLGNWT